MKPTITLCMIVKDESHIIHEALESISPFVDRYDICDTGSSDNTKEIIKDFFDKKGIPGEVYDIPWQGFGKSRTEALRKCEGKADYAWMMDADDKLNGTPDLEFIERTMASSYSLRIVRGEGFTWWRNQIFKTDDGWKYLGILHEYADVEDREGKASMQLAGDYTLEARTEGARNVGITPREKYLKDAELLEKCLTDKEFEHYDPDNHRYHFYLAQSYFDAGEYQSAQDWYKKRASLGGWEEEVYYSIYRIAICSGLLSDPWEKTLMHFLMAWDYRPHRVEALHQISRVFRLNNKPKLANIYARMGKDVPFPHFDILFISGEVYEWQILDEYASTAFYTGDLDGGLAATEELLTNRNLPESELARVRNNHKEYKKAIEDRTKFYNQQESERKKWQEEQDSKAKEIRDRKMQEQESRVAKKEKAKKQKQRRAQRKARKTRV